MLHLSLEVSERRSAVYGRNDVKCIDWQCKTIMNVYSFYYNHTVFAVAAVACLLIVQTTLCPFEEIASPVHGQFKLDNRGNLGMSATNLEILRTNRDIPVICTIQTYDPRANSADVREPSTKTSNDRLRPWAKARTHWLASTTRVDHRLVMAGRHVDPASIGHWVHVQPFHGVQS